MKVRWYLFDLSPLMINYLKADFNFFKYHTLYRATKFLESMDSSLSVKLLSKVPQSDLIFQMVRNQNEFTADQIDQVLDYAVKTGELGGNGCTVLEFFISDTFIQTQESVKNPINDVYKRVKQFKKKFNFRGENGYQIDASSHQGYIDFIQSELMHTYTRNFHGEILDDDGKELIVRKLKKYETE